MSLDTASLVVKTLVLYAIAEAQAGHASQIQVSVDGRSFSIADNGRGHSMNREVGGVPYVQVLYGQLAYPFALAKGPAVQLQGLATSLVQALCTELTVTMRRDGVAHCMAIHQGRITSSSRPMAPGECSGNTVEGMLHPGLPSAPEPEALQEWLQQAAASVAGLSIRFKGHGQAQRAYRVTEADPLGADALALLRQAAVEARELYPELHTPGGPWPSNTPTPARGVYLVAYLDDQPVAMGAHRPIDDVSTEVRRMFVARPARRFGAARTILQALQDHARSQGFRQLLLETGFRQVAAMALYESCGFTRIPPFGAHAADPTSVCFAKPIPAASAA